MFWTLKPPMSGEWVRTWPTVSIVFYGISLALFLYTGRQMLGHRRGL